VCEWSEEDQSALTDFRPREKNRTVPAGTYLEFKGNDIITVELGSRLVSNATSSGDWINLARELGQIGDYFP
jgi:hypothetical protein